MSVLYALIAVAFLIYLVLRIIRMLGGRTTVTRQTPAAQNPPAFDPTRFNTAPLPERTPQELKRIAETMPTEWVTYNGISPPLRLKIQGQTYEGFRRVIRKYIDRIGQDHFDQLSPPQREEFMFPVLADAYVADWEGALYSNGNAMPFTPANLAIIMARDPHLTALIQNEAERIGPPWPTR